MDQFQQLKKFKFADSSYRIWPTGIPYVCPSEVTSKAATGAANYGCWDGSNFWIGGNNNLYKIDSNFTLSTYPGFGTNGGQTIQMAFDGSNLWVGDYDTKATWFKFNPTSESVLSSGELYPNAAGPGGIQGVIFDGQKVWYGAPDIVVRMNPTSNLVEMTVSGQINVNGLSHYTDGSGQRYILAANRNNWSKINADTGAYTTYDSIDHSAGYRLCNDGVYCYVAFNTFPGKVRKYLLENGNLISTWTVGGALNSINFDGANLWTVDGSHQVNVTDTNGTLLCTILGLGKSDVVIGNGHAWAVDWGGVSGSLVHRIRMQNPPIVSGLTNGYSIKVLDSYGSEIQGAINTTISGTTYLSGYNIGGLYILNYNGYIAAKKNFPSGIPLGSSLSFV